MPDLPLILGGHSTIQQLGNEPAPSPVDIDRIVSRCLDAGIRWFDITYRPERIALGLSLERLGRRAEARIIAWNFFQLFEADGDVGGPEAYLERHLPEMLADLRSERIDALVVHGVDDPAQQERQERLAEAWQQRGLVGQLGLWAPGIAAADQADTIRRYTFVVEPHNVATRNSAAKLEAYARAGWQVYACSPFVRGWELDRLVERAVRRDSLPTSAARERIADLMLRYSLFAPHVNRLIVAMRRPEWVDSAVQAAQRGPLRPDERSYLDNLGMP